MENEKLLPKPELDLPLPRLAEASAKRAEKELPAHSDLASQGQALRSYGRKFPLPKYVFLGTVFVILVVLIGGAYIFVKSSNKNSVAIPSPDPVVYEASPTSDPTADWITYNATFDTFSVKYPPTLKLHEDKNQEKVFRIFIENFDESAGILPKKTPEDFQLVIQPEPLVKNPNLETLRKIQEDQGNKTTDFTIDGNPAFKYSVTAKETDQQVTVVTVHDGKMYSFLSQTTKSQYISLFDQILSTFRFD